MPPRVRCSASIVRSRPTKPSVSKSNVTSLTFSSPFCTMMVLAPARSGRTSPEPKVVSRKTLTLVGVTGWVPVPPDSVNSELVVMICRNRPGIIWRMTLTWPDAIVMLIASSSFVPGVMFSKSAVFELKMVCGWPSVPAKYRRSS